MKKIGILGGTFDPFHNGHLKLATGALIEFALDFVFLMPTKKNPFKQDKHISSDEDRVNMIKLACKDRPFLCLLDKEIREDESVSYTYDTMSELLNEFEGCELFFILGLDSFLSLEKWYKGKELLSMISFIVSVRPGYDQAKLDETIRRYEEEYNAHIFVIEDNMPDISSTQIRNLARENKSIEGLVPEEIERYIFENEIYSRSN